MAALDAPSPLANLRLVLVSPRNPLNIGAAARALLNFGAQHLRVVNPYQVAFQNARSAVGAASVLQSAQSFPSVAEAVADCVLVAGTTAGTARQPQQPLHPLAPGSVLVRQALAQGPVALLFGSEKRGLTNQEMDHCQLLLRIPTREEQPSMNLGQAVAICLYELARPSAGELSSPADAPPAAAADLERLTLLLSQALQSSGYTSEQTGRITEEKTRRLIRRLRLTAIDADVLLGMLRQMEWKLRRD